MGMVKMTVMVKWSSFRIPVKADMVEVITYSQLI
jgi:hypothetical protein